MELTWDRVLAWRLHRQHVAPVGTVDAVAVARRLAGVQAQVPSAAELSVAVRQRRPEPEGVPRALADRRLVRTWAMRGTLHLLPVDDVAAYLALLATGRTWEKGSWQRSFLPTARLAVLAEAVAEALDGPPLSREELAAAVAERVRDEAVTEQLRSGWGAVLKPLAWQGLLCHGPADGPRVTFTRPDRYLPGWTGLPDPDAAARVVLPAYLGAYGPAAPEAFDQWLLRGATPRRALRGWLADLGDELATVTVEGRALIARAADLDDLAAARPSDAVRLLPGFDAYVLGPGTAAAEVVPPPRRPLVSRAGGWISPVVVAGGRVAGTWTGGAAGIEVTLFGEAPALPDGALAAEAARVAGLLGSGDGLSVRTV